MKLLYKKSDLTCEYMDLEPVIKKSELVTYKTTHAICHVK